MPGPPKQGILRKGRSAWDQRAGKAKVRLTKAEIGVAILVLSVGLLTVMVVTRAAPSDAVIRIVAIVVAAAAILSGLGLAWLGRRWERRLDQLRGWVHLVAGEMEPAGGPAAGIDSIDRVQLAIIDMLGIRMDQQFAIYRRMEEVLNALPDGIVAVTPEGLVSLVNAAGRPLFGADSGVVGKSLFDTIAPDSLGEALTRAQGAGRPIAAVLQTVWGAALEVTIAPIGSDGSALLRYPATAAVSVGLQHDLSLHDRPTRSIQVTAETPLSALPLVAVDTETTGLDTGRDRIVSIGAVRLQGNRLVRSGPLNLLLNPGRPIPSRTIAVHGISNSMVADAPQFAAVADRVVDYMAGMVLVGHQIWFDLAMLRSEMRRCGRDWTPPVGLDVMLLYAGLFPDRHALSLDAIAAELAVPVVGRHSALGDALTAGEVYLRLLTILADQGVGTFGAADALQRRTASRLGSGKTVTG